MRESEAPESSHPGRLTNEIQRIIAVGGGRAGVGQSTLSVNLAVYLAQLGRSVVIVDADSQSAALHTLLGMELPPTPKDFDSTEMENLVPLPTPVPGLEILPQIYTRESTTPLRPGRKPRWSKGLRHLNAEFVIIDLGTGTSSALLDLFQMADLSICVTAPDPVSIETTYRFHKALYFRALRKMLMRDRYRMRQADRALAELPPLPNPIDVVHALSRFDSSTGRAAAELLATIRPALVVNSTRLRSDVELGSQLIALSARHLGIHLESLGHVEHDDAIWVSVVRRVPVLINNPTSKGARNLEKIARRVMGLCSARDTQATPTPIDLEPVEASLYDILWTNRSASDEELRRAYKRQRDIFQTNSLALTSLIANDEIPAYQAKIEEAQEILLDPIRRRTYDLSFFADLEEEPTDEDAPLDAARQAEQALLKKELAEEIHPETLYTGKLLRKIRQSRGVEIDEIARKTKIAAAHLRAIEDEDFDHLPAEVYTRGFVQQLCLYLEVDPSQGVRSYIRRLREVRSQAPPRGRL